MEKLLRELREATGQSIVEGGSIEGSLKEWPERVMNRSEDTDVFSEDMRPLLEGESYTDAYLSKMSQHLLKADNAVKSAEERLDKARRN